MQEKYADVLLPWPDVKAAASLCVGGPVKYKVKEGCGISDEWLVLHVAPGIASQFSNEVAAILAKPLLWAVFDPDVSSMVPASIRQRVVTAYNALGEDLRLADNQNPIEKVELVCYENNGVVAIDEIPNDVPMVQGGGGNPEADLEECDVCEGIECGTKAGNYSEQSGESLRDDGPSVQNIGSKHKQNCTTTSCASGSTSRRRR